MVQYGTTKTRIKYRYINIVSSRYIKVAISLSAELFRTKLSSSALSNS